MRQSESISPDFRPERHRRLRVSLSLGETSVQDGKASQHFAELNLWSKFHRLHLRRPVSQKYLPGFRQSSACVLSVPCCWGVNLQSLRTLKLIKTFNKSFNSLELPQLENLSFSDNFNRDLDLACCPKLKSLSFGSAPTDLGLAVFLFLKGKFRFLITFEVAERWVLYLQSQRKIPWELTPPN